MLTITYTIECHCGAAAKSTTTHLDLSPGEPLVINAELTIGQTDFWCDDCGCVTGTGDIDTEIAQRGPNCEGDDDD